MFGDLDQGVPQPLRQQTGTDLQPVRNQVTQQEVSDRPGSKASSTLYMHYCMNHPIQPLLTLAEKLRSLIIYFFLPCLAVPYGFLIFSFYGC